MRLLTALMLATWCTTSLAQWNYRTETDPMGGSIQTAVVQSTNEITFSSPYGGPQKGYVHLRVHPRHGRDVMFSIRRGQFMCRLDGCTVLVRFDDGKPERWRAVEPVDHSPEVVFLRDYTRFLRSIRAAKLMRIEATFFHQGSRVFEFNVAGLDFDKATKAAPAKTAEQIRWARVHEEEILNSCTTEAGKRELEGVERKAFIAKCRRNHPRP